MRHLAPELREDQALLAEVAGVAAWVLKRHGADPAAAVRTDGWVNPGWMSDRLVVRVGLVARRTSLHREARVAKLVPGAVGYPEVIEVGVRDGYEYLLTRRVPGTSLSAAWPTLTGSERADALTRVWELAEHVHSTDVAGHDGLDGLEPMVSPFYADSPSDPEDGLNRLWVAGLLTRRQRDSLIAQVDEFFEAKDSGLSVLNHGDLHIGNAMWDGDRVVGLLDMEFAVLAPVELDFNELAKHAFAPEGTPAVGGHANELRTAIVEIASDLDPDPALLKGYSILLEAWLTMRELGHLQPGEITTRQSHRLLVALAEHEGGYLAPLLEA